MIDDLGTNNSHFERRGEAFAAKIGDLSTVRKQMLRPNRHIENCCLGTATYEADTCLWYNSIRLVFFLLNIKDKRNGIKYFDP